MFNELVNEVISLIESRESRERSHIEKDKSSFQYSVEYILKDLWLASKSVPVRETIMHKRSGHYSDNPRYRDPKLTYRPTMAAFEGLLNLTFKPREVRLHVLLPEMNYWIDLVSWMDTLLFPLHLTLIVKLLFYEIV